MGIALGLGGEVVLLIRISRGGVVGNGILSRSIRATSGWLGGGFSDTGTLVVVVIMVVVGGLVVVVGGLVVVDLGALVVVVVVAVGVEL